jgi:hypothetical protein
MNMTQTIFAPICPIIKKKEVRVE